MLYARRSAANYSRTLPDRADAHPRADGYEFASASRILYVNGKEEAPVDSWMGHSNARWDGDTFVVDVTGFNDTTWFDRPGTTTARRCTWSSAIRSPTEHNQLRSQLEDPKTFTRPWKMNFRSIVVRRRTLSSRIQVRGVRRRADVRLSAREQ